MIGNDYAKINRDIMSLQIIPCSESTKSDQNLQKYTWCANSCAIVRRTRILMKGSYKFESYRIFCSWVILKPQLSEENAAKSGNAIISVKGKQFKMMRIAKLTFRKREKINVKSKVFTSINFSVWHNFFLSNINFCCKFL